MSDLSLRCFANPFILHALCVSLMAPHRLAGRQAVEASQSSMGELCDGELGSLANSDTLVVRSTLKSQLGVLGENVLILAQEGGEGSKFLGQDTELEVKLIDEVEEERKEATLDCCFETGDVGDDLFQKVLIGNGQVRNWLQEALEAGRHGVWNTQAQNVGCALN